MVYSSLGGWAVDGMDLSGFENASQSMWGDDLLPDTFAHVLYSLSEKASKGERVDWFNELGMCWKRWLDAAESGRVVYIQQPNDGENYQDIFSDFSKVYLQKMERHYAFDSIRYQESPFSCRQEFATLLKTISRIPQRSKAFNEIDKSSLPENSQDADSRSLPYTKRALKDWYQVVYQRSFAEYLGAPLIAVDVADCSVRGVLEGSDEAENELGLILSGEITDILSGMPAVCFTRFCYEHRESIRKWRACGKSTPTRKKRECCRNIAYYALAMNDEDTLKSEGWNSAIGLIAISVVAGLAVLADMAWDMSSLPFALALIVSWAINVISNMDLVSTVKTILRVKSSTNTIVYPDV